MKKTTILFLAVLLLSGCAAMKEPKNSPSSTPEQTPVTERATITPQTTQESQSIKQILNDHLVLIISTELPEPEYAISDSDYEKYNYIMSYLNKHLDKSEDVLLDELSDVYKESAESLKEFMNSVMQDAVDRDMGKTKNTVEVKQSDLENITTKFFVANVVDESLFKLEKFDSSEINALNAIVKGTLSYDGIEHSFILKFKVEANLQNANIFQLKLDEKNIELK